MGGSLGLFTVVQVVYDGHGAMPAMVERGTFQLEHFVVILLVSGSIKWALRVQVNIVVASVDGHMADDQVRTSSKVARGTPKWRSS